MLTKLTFKNLFTPKLLSVALLLAVAIAVYEIRFNPVMICESSDEATGLKLRFWAFRYSVKLQITDAMNRQYQCHGSGSWYNRTLSREPYIKMESGFLEPCSPTLTDEIDDVLRNQVDYRYTLTTGASELRWKIYSMPLTCEISVMRFQAVLD